MPTYTEAKAEERVALGRMLAIDNASRGAHCAYKNAVERSWLLERALGILTVRGDWPSMTEFCADEYELMLGRGAASG